MAKLNAKSVESWYKASKRQEIPDDLLPGLYFIVQPTGKKSWQGR